MKHYDREGIELKDGDVIDLHQTVNGRSLFKIITLEPLDIKYNFDLSYRYEYDKEDLLKPCRYSGETEYEIINRNYESNN